MRVAAAMAATVVMATEIAAAARATVAEATALAAAAWASVTKAVAAEAVLLAASHRRASRPAYCNIHHRCSHLSCKV